jgi:glyoxalase family protein
MTKGIHHITAIASDAAKTVQFYTEVLGLRLVKKTVNQDDTKTYHLFFGDKLGHAGMDLTFFIFLPAQQGRAGVGSVTTISFAVPENSLDFWIERFTKMNIKHEGITTRFGKQRISFYDSDMQHLELVGVPENELDTTADIWTTDAVTSDTAIRNFYSAGMTVSNIELIEPVLTYVFGYELQEVAEDTYLYAVSDSQRAHYLEVTIDRTNDRGIQTAGTVHHIAFRAQDKQEQFEFRKNILKLGLYPTEVVDRFYFKSVYFRTPAGILFEIATDGPGFTVDEPVQELGKKLALPPFLENKRPLIEANLPPLSKV